jgi:hypothetical protein
MICSSNEFFLTIQIQKCTDFKKFAFLRCFLDDLQFKCIFHKQSGSEIQVRAGSESGYEKKNNFGSTNLNLRILPL